jgi:hypothetical protein
VGCDTFWVIFLTNSSGHTSSTVLLELGAKFLQVIAPQPNPFTGEVDYEGPSESTYDTEEDLSAQDLVISVPIILSPKLPLKLPSQTSLSNFPLKLPSQTSLSNFHGISSQGSLLNNLLFNAES